MSDPEVRLTTALSDRYEIEHELGHGGMAIVYLANDVKHDRKVALKVLRPELAAVIGAERFLQEIKVTANLHSYDNENWLILMSTDHGRSDNGGHGGQSLEERTIFYLASGSSFMESGQPDGPFIVDIAVTALDHLGVAIDPAWGLDGTVRR